MLFTNGFQLRTRNSQFLSFFFPIIVQYRTVLTRNLKEKTFNV